LPLIAGTVILTALTTAVAAAPVSDAGGARPARRQVAAPTVAHYTDVARNAAPARPSGRPAARPVPTVARYTESVSAFAADPIRVPPSVALDPELTKPLPGDTPQTRAARRKLAEIGDVYQLANQRYDQARADAAQAAVEVTRARAAAAVAKHRAMVAHAEFAMLITAQYEGVEAPDAAWLLASGPEDVLAELEMQRLVAERNAAILSTARQTQAAAVAAQQRVERAEAAADAAERMANVQLATAASALKLAQQTVAQLHARDLAAAMSAAAHSLAGAATAIQAQAVASGAAVEKDFARATGPAQVIAIGTRALLEQAAGRRKAPGATSVGVPPYHATHGAPVDEQAVMGPTADLGGSVPYTGETGAGPVLALTRFDGVLSESGWPNAGVGTKVRGTAPFLKSDGVSVHPELPGYRKGYHPLRAEVAVDAALAQLGSPYVWDAAGPTTFDCSGLTLWAWGHAGVPLEHYTGIQVHQGVRVDVNELLPGDLLLFGKSLHHVGMYLGAGYMIDAPTTGDYVKVQPVADDGDFAVAVRP
jgi:hypothetical protein